MSRWAPVTSGPMSAPSRPSPVVSAPIREVIASTRPSPTGSTATTTEIAMHRSPADPKPARDRRVGSVVEVRVGQHHHVVLGPAEGLTRLPWAVPVS